MNGYKKQLQRDKRDMHTHALGLHLMIDLTRYQHGARKRLHQLKIVAINQFQVNKM